MARFRLEMPDGKQHTIPLSEVDIKVSADGYVRSVTPYGKTMELLLSFNEVVAAMQEERDLWK